MGFIEAIITETEDVFPVVIELMDGITIVNGAKDWFAILSFRVIPRSLVIFFPAFRTFCAPRAA